MGVIFDLDQTLIESAPAEPLRKARKWPEVYKIIPELQPYDGISELLEILSLSGIPLCIVTSSPSSYCQRVISYWKWKIDATVCFHDTKNKKPHPEPIFLGIKKMNVLKDKVVVIGDDAKDIYAAQRAGVYSVAVMWGANDKEGLLKSKPNKVFAEVLELKEFLYEYYNLK